jgi:hypothetical protein
MPQSIPEKSYDPNLGILVGLFSDENGQGSSQV